MEIQAKEKAALTETTAAQTNTNKMIIAQERPNEQEKNLKILQENIEKAHEAALNNPRAMEHFHKRGLTDETIKRFQLGYSENGFNAILPPKYRVGKKAKYYKYILPFLDENGAAVYAISEYYDRENKPKEYSKYYNPRGENAPIFGEHYLRAENPPEWIFVCEGVYDALSVEQACGAAIALRGTGKSRLLNICQQCKTETNFIIIGDNDFDKEAEGKENTGQVNAKKLQIAFDEIGYFSYITPATKGIKDANERLKANPQEFQEFIEGCLLLGDTKRKEWQEKKETEPKQTEPNISDNLIFVDRFFDGKRFLHNVFARFLRDNENIRRIEKRLHIYRNGVYSPDTSNLENVMIRHIPTLRNAQRNEVLRYLDILIRDDEEPAKPRYIPFKNGIFDITDGVLLPPSADFVLTNLIPWNYNQQAYSNEGENFLDDVACGDEEIKALFEEMIGYCFYRENIFKKAFILLGNGSNGKSTFLYALQKLLGEDNLSSLDLGELNQRFKSAELFGRLANIGDDISSNYIEDTAVFKKLCTGERITAEFKGERPFAFSNRAKLIFSANDLPRIKDSTGAAKERLCIIPFNANFNRAAGNLDPHLREKLNTPEVMEYFVKIGIEGLKRLIENGEFTTPQCVKMELEKYELQNNPVKVFLKELEENEKSVLGVAVEDVYCNYKRFCDNNGFKGIGSRTSLTQEVKRLTGYSTKVARQNIKGESKLRRIFSMD